MRRSIFKAGVWTALGLAIAFAVVSANSNTRRAVTAAPAAKATVANAASTADCTPSDVCCARDTKSAVVASATRKARPVAKVALPAPAAAFQSGAVIAIDPETGELGMPSPQQMAELEGTPSVIPSDLNNSDVGLTDVHHANGMVSRDLQGRFQEVATIRIDATGKLVLGCGDHKDAPTQSAQPALEEK